MKSKQNRKTQKDRFAGDRRNSIVPLQPAPQTRQAAGAANQWLTGEGEMTRRIREFDWSQTALGAASLWPASLRAATSICLNSRFPMFIAWGAHRAMLYNDAYIAVLAGKHPGALGRPAQEVWGEIWHILGPHWAHVSDKGEATWAKDLLLLMNRSGYDEETYFTFSYSPIRDETGSVGGMFCACQETTDKVVGERRLRTLRELAAQATMAKNAREACATAAKTLSDNPSDLPFALLYLSDDSRDRASLAGAAGLAGDGRASPSCVALDGEDSDGWPLGQVLREGAARCIENLPDRLGSLPAGPWTQPTTRALLLPLQLAAHELPAGVLIAGVSPVRPLDEGYRTFLEVAAGQIASAIANARAYERERQKAEALAELDRAKTAFFSNVSHEFRTPLTLMLGPVEELLGRSHTDLTPAAKGQLEVVNRNGLRLLRLVNTLLDFSRIEAGRVQAVFEPTDLAAFTSELAGVFRAATERAGLGLRVDCPKLPEPVYVDRDMWEKIVLNLLSNAFKFTFEGEIEVRIRAESSNAILTVRDTGVGIPAEELPRLFERFHRVQNMRSRTHEGSGIGLALVQELVKLHGGSIRAESRLGQGASFIVTVPLGAKHLPPDRLGGSRSLASTAVGAAPFVEEALRWLPEAAPVEEATLPPSHHELIPISCPAGEGDDVEGRPRIVVADDNADMRHYLARLLRERYNVEAVPNGQAALAAARERRPDLILSDVMMPNLDGFGLVRELRADSDLKTIPIILLSARAGEESRVEGLQQGADDYLIKPFSARELMARVAAHLDMARLRKEADAQIRRSQRNLTEAQRIGHVGSWEWNIETGQVTWSERLYSIYGVDPTAFVPTIESFAGFVHPDDRELVNRKINEIRSSGCRADFEFRILSADGATRVLTTQGEITEFDEDGMPRLMVGVNQDITERKQAAEALRESEEKFKRIVETANEGIWTVDAKTVTTFVNAKMAEMLGYTPDEMIGKPAWDFMDEEGIALARKRLEVRVKGVGESYEHKYLCKDGSPVWTIANVTPLKDGEGRFAGSIGLLTDITERKQAEEALHRSQQTFSELVERSPFGAYIVDSRFRIALMNASSQEGAFRNVRPIIGRPFDEAMRILWPEPVAAEIIGHFRHTLATGEPYYSPRFTNPRHDADIIESYEWELHRLTLPDGQRGVICYYYDSTKLRTAEDALRESEARFRLALKNSPVLVTIQDADLVYRWAFNTRTRQPEEVVGKTDADLFAPDEAAALMAAKRQVLETGADVRRAFWLTSNRQRVFLDCYYEPVRDAAGSVIGVGGASVNLTEQKRAEEALRDSEERFRSYFEVGLIGAAVTSPVKGFVEVNDEICRILGYPREELLRKSWAEITHQDDLAADVANFKRVMAGEIDSYTTDKRFIRKDGRVIDTTISVRAVRDGDRSVDYFVALLQDITQRKQAEMELKEANDGLAQAARELARSNEDLQQFAYAASHDLQEPLRMVSGFLKLLQERYAPQLDAKAKEYIGYSIDGAARMSSLIRDLLEYSQAGRKTKELQLINPRDALTSALASLRTAVQEAGATVTHDELPTIHGDSSQLTQLFQNLVGNAVKFRSPERPCQIHVGVKRVIGHRSLVSGQQSWVSSLPMDQSPMTNDTAQRPMTNDSSWLFSVRDNGIGIPQDAFDRIFTIFQRLHTREQYPGTGIGLAVCKKIVERHGGRIWVESTPGEGSTFFFTLSGGVP